MQAVWYAYWVLQTEDTLDEHLYSQQVNVGDEDKEHHLEFWIAESSLCLRFEVYLGIDISPLCSCWFAFQVHYVCCLN